MAPLSFTPLKPSSRLWLTCLSGVSAIAATLSIHLAAISAIAQTPPPGTVTTPTTPTTPTPTTPSPAPAVAPPTPSYPPNPLEPSEPDPLLPRLTVDRPLSPQERSIVSAAIVELEQIGNAKIQAGDLRGALEAWLRELRLRRVLGLEEEVPALGRVGEIAWRESQTTEVRAITERLQAIEAEVESQTPVNDRMLLTIAQSYSKLRAIEPATSLYGELLTKARQAQNRPLEKATLANLGQLHLALFDFTNAATSYEQLVSLARAENNRVDEIAHLRQLSFIYDQGNQPQKLIETHQRLVSIYEQQRQLTAIPPLKLAMGNAYLLLNRPDLAAPNFQEAFAVARTTQQYGFAGDALQRLATLYRSLQRLDDALVVYRLLLDVRQQSYDLVGIMNVYDEMAQVFRERGNVPQAIAHYQRALQFAQQLSYASKVSYFTTQIQQASQPIAPAGGT